MVLKGDLELTVKLSGEEPYARLDNPLVISLKFWLDSEFHTLCLALEVCRHLLMWNTCIQCVLLR